VAHISGMGKPTKKPPPPPDELLKEMRAIYRDAIKEATEFVEETERRLARMKRIIARAEAIANEPTRKRD
jgi:hypothetical protein